MHHRGVSIIIMPWAFFRSIGAFYQFYFSKWTIQLSVSIRVITERHIAVVILFFLFNVLGAWQKQKIDCELFCFAGIPKPLYFHL
jgi:hypothetical protein